jgi:hypothetical protein
MNINNLIPSQPIPNNIVCNIYGLTCILLDTCLLKNHCWNNIFYVWINKLLGSTYKYLCKPTFLLGLPKMTNACSTQLWTYLGNTFLNIPKSNSRYTSHSCVFAPLKKTWYKSGTQRSNSTGAKKLSSTE